MTTQAKIGKASQQLSRYQQNLALQKIKERKADTRNKIQLGGLVIKANMQDYAKSVILGALIDACEQLERDDAILALFKAKGEATFLGHKGD